MMHNKTTTDTKAIYRAGSIKAAGMAPTPAEVTSLCAIMAMAGHHVTKGSTGDYTISKFGLSRYCPDFAELQAFAVKVGAVRHDTD